MSDCCDLFPEEWKPVPGYEDYYLVSNHGRLLSLRAPVGWRKVPRLLKPGSSQGWLRVVLCKEGPKKVHAVHRLVLETFVSPCPEGLQCSHQDGVRGNNHVDNLRWETAKENSGKRAIHGTQTQGSVHGSAKLTERKVLRIKRLLARNVTLQEIADQYGVTDVTISCIKTNKTWKHVVLEE